MASVAAAPFPVLHLMTSSSWPDGALAKTSIPKNVVCDLDACPALPLVLQRQVGIAPPVRSCRYWLMAMITPTTPFMPSQPPLIKSRLGPRSAKRRIAKPANMQTQIHLRELTIHCGNRICRPMPRRGPIRLVNCSACEDRTIRKHLECVARRLCGVHESEI